MHLKLKHVNRKVWSYKKPTGLNHLVTCRGVAFNFGIH